MLSRGEIVDVLYGGEDCLVLLENRCLRLTAVAAEAVDLLDRPYAVGEVERHLEQRFGPAPEGRLEQILTDLVEAGVLRRSKSVHSDDS